MALMERKNREIRQAMTRLGCTVESEGGGLALHPAHPNTYQLKICFPHSQSKEAELILYDKINRVLENLGFSPSLIIAVFGPYTPDSNGRETSYLFFWFYQDLVDAFLEDELRNSPSHATG
jgi:hypothetical protein